MHHHPSLSRFGLIMQTTLLHSLLAVIDVLAPFTHFWSHDLPSLSSPYDVLGERYATGDKARRFYEKAGDMYNKACQLNPEDSDCLYNL
jgi:hypothetical protein